MDSENEIESAKIVDAIKIKGIETAHEGVHSTIEIEVGNKINTSTAALKGEDELYKLLKEYRTKVSKEENLKPFMVFTNQELDSIVESKPKSNIELLEIRGLGAKKVEKYRESILKIINE